LMIAILPVAITAGLVYFKPKLAGRYAWPAWIGFDLLVALFLARLVQLGRWRRPLALLTLVVIIAVPWTTHAVGRPPDSDFRAAYAYLCTHGDPGDTVILHDGTLSVVDAYYGQRDPCTLHRHTISLPEAEITNIDTALTLKTAQNAMQDILTQRPPNVWVVSWQSDVMDPQNLALGLLDGTGAHSVTAQMFGDVRLDRYEQPAPLTGDPLALGRGENIQPIPNGPTLRSLRLFAPDMAHDGDVIVVQAWWTLGKTLQPDLRVSARLGPPEGGKPYVQVDQPPSAYKYMDDRWQGGVPSLGRYELTVTPQVSAGPVAVDYVLYDANSRWQAIILHVGQITVIR
ncbi:MAG TPA: hypothetical protein VKQ72_21960, partial [Aggregatilineales bacterium]|nr:hypothetical protein [Aggregatilineales bacterium]